MYAQGTLASLSHFGLLPVPRAFYAVTAFAALVALVVCYWALYERLRDACWVLPAAAYWLAYRPVVLYWVFWLLPALAVIASRPPRERVPLPERAPRWRVAALALATAAAVAVVGLAWTVARPTVAVTVRGPLSVMDGRVVRMNVEVTNLTSSAFSPRLAVQSIHALFNSQPWQIEDGPFTLAPHTTATYRIASSRDDRTFFPFEPAQVVVTGAGGDYTLRGIATLEPDQSWLDPDAILNSTFRFWDEGGESPVGWMLDVAPGVRARPRSLRATVRRRCDSRWVPVRRHASRSARASCSRRARSASALRSRATRGRPPRSSSTTARAESGSRCLRPPDGSSTRSTSRPSMHAPDFPLRRPRVRSIASSTSRCRWLD